MQARRASRELALILFSQFEKEITHYSRKDFENEISKSHRPQVDLAIKYAEKVFGSDFPPY